MAGKIQVFWAGGVDEISRYTNALRAQTGGV